MSNKSESKPSAFSTTSKTNQLRTENNPRFKVLPEGRINELASLCLKNRRRVRLFDVEPALY